VRRRIVTDEYHIEARRPHWQRPEVGDQTDEREATHRRLSSGAGYGPDGDIRAGNTKAVREQPERLRANAKRGVEHGVRARPNARQ